MSQPRGKQPSGGAATAIVEDLFLTDAFLIKGRIANKYQRLTKMLEDNERMFLAVLDATLISLRGGEVIRAPSVHVSRTEIIVAHELVDTASDGDQRKLAINDKPMRIRAFYSGQVQLELAGYVAAGAYERGPSGRWYFIMQQPVIRGLQLDGHQELAVLQSLPYVIVRKDKLSYVYDFSSAAGPIRSP